MGKELNEEQKVRFAELFNERYIVNRGFGSMNKNDIEVMLFDIYREIFDSGGNMTNYQWSIELRIPETKVRKLSYEADLLYHTYDVKALKDEFFNILEKNITKFSNDNKKIQFVIENRSLRTMISADLKALGYFADASFNSEIVSVDLTAFSALLLTYYPEEFTEKFSNECKTLSNIKSSEKINCTEILQKLLEGIAKGTGEAIPSIIKDLVRAYTDPVNTAIKIAKIVRKLI